MDDLDLIDRKIIAELMRDATLPVAQIADKVGLSQTPCWKRIQKLEAAGVITSRVALVDPALAALARGGAGQAGQGFVGPLDGGAAQVGQGHVPGDRLAIGRDRILEIDYRC